MVRLPPAALVLVLAACRDGGDAATTTIVTGVTSNVTTLTPETSSTTTSTTSTTDASGSEGASATGSTTGDGSSTSTTTTTGDATTAVDVSTTTTTTGPADPVAECLANVDPGDECSACICTDCLELWDACHADQGCTAMQECAQTNGCYGLDCYNGPCFTTINLWGPVPGPSWGLWFPLTNCLEATCRPLCPW